jgi:Tol biopolymer transport system component
MRKRIRITAVVLAATVAGCTGGTGNGSAVQQSIPPRSPIAFVRGVDHVMLLDGNGSVRYVAEGDQPQWSPDYHWLVVDRPDFTQTPPASDLWLVSPNSGASQRISSIWPQQVRFFAVGGSPPFAVYDDSRGVWAINFDGSHRRSVFINSPDTYSINDLALTVNGSKLAYVSQNNSNSYFSLRIADIDGSSDRLVFAGTENTCNITSPSWSPDGKWIAFSLCAEKGGQDDITMIWLIHPDGTGMHSLVEGSESTWSTDGNWLAFLGAAPSGNSFALFRIRTNGTGRAQLTPYASSNGNLEDGSPNW